METYTLNNGVNVPVIAFGPGIPGYGKHIIQGNTLYYKVLRRLQMEGILWKYYNANLNAIHNGYCFIDYSMSYGREDLIGKAIRKSHCARNEIILTTRISNPVQFEGNIREMFFRSLERFQTDYTDLLMFHWPVTDHYVETYREMEKLYREGYVRILGVANCHQHHLDRLEMECEILPAINQVEVHPLFTQKSLIEYCKSKGIIVQAYTPIARYDDRMVRLPLLKKIAGKYQKTITQIILRWHIQNGLIPVIRSLNKQRQCENISIFDFLLTSEEMKQIDSININSRMRYDPDNCDFSIL